ncbi:MAG: hypothetical protein Q7K98_07735 [Candidatus Omnitrophota bacterium]|nr:hypothetical protein [Candidatus Omnitrophota bacterium]
MIKKDELITLLRKGLDMEEKGIPIYARHIDKIIFLSGLSQEDQEKIKSTLMTLKQDSEGHKIIFQELINKITESTRNVF